MSDCIIWAGVVDRDGYGRRGTSGRAHRLAYIAANGLIPEGHEIHHACHVKLCVNPDHLVAVTRAEHNLLHAADVTHCKHGHEFTPENTYDRSNHKDAGRRGCRRCNAAAVKRYRERVQALHGTGAAA